MTVKKEKKKARRNCFLCKHYARLYFYGLYLLTLAIFPACCTALDLAGSPMKWNNISEKVGSLIAWRGHGKLQPSKLMTFSHVALKPRPATRADSSLLWSHEKIQIWGSDPTPQWSHLPPAALFCASTKSPYLPVQLQAEICTLCRYRFVFRWAK